MDCQEVIIKPLQHKKIRLNIFHTVLNTFPEL